MCSLPVWKVLRAPEDKSKRPTIFYRLGFGLIKTSRGLACVLRDLGEGWREVKHMKSGNNGAKIARWPGIINTVYPQIDTIDRCRDITTAGATL